MKCTFLPHLCLGMKLFHCFVLKNKQIDKKGVFFFMNHSSAGTVQSGGQGQHGIWGKPSRDRFDF